MKPVREPRVDSGYIIAPESAPQSKLWYVVIQVSERRYVVAEYDGGAGKGTLPMGFVVVSKSMGYSKAIQLCQELTKKKERARKK